MTPRSASHEVVDHTSEIVLRVGAPSFPDLIAEAAGAFSELVPERLRRREQTEWTEMEVRGRDRGALLVGWLNELVFRAETELWVPADVEVLEVGPAALRVRCRGLRLTAPFVLVKAATLHDLDLLEDADGFEAEVTLDV